MQIGSTLIEFVGMGSNETGQPFEGLTLTSATYTDTICDIPTGTIQFSLASTRAASNPFNFDTNLKALARQQIKISLFGVAAAGATIGTLLKTISGIVTKISSSRGTDNKVTDFTIEIIMWLKGTPGTTGTTGTNSTPASRIYTKAYRFFENKTSIGIAKEIMIGAGGADPVLTPLTISRVTTRRYEVQYGESDINFIKRILAEDGLLFCMRNGTDGMLTLHIFDALSSFPQTWIEVSTGTSTSTTVGQKTSVYNATQSIEPTIDSVALAASYNSAGNVDDRGNHENTSTSRGLWVEVEVNATYETTGSTPSYSDLLSPQSETILQSNSADVHTFDYDAEVLEIGNKYIVMGAALSLSPQPVFRHIINIISTKYSIFKSSTNLYFSSTVQCKDATSVHRVKPLPRPSLPGLLRGIVLSAPGAPAYAAPGTDKLVNTDAVGRVQVRILWHAEAEAGVTAPTSQPWLRVMTPFAGQGAGFFALPRDGQEVIISFVNGDASQPIVMGCVYDETGTTPINAPWNIDTSIKDREWVGIGTHRPTADDHGQHIRLDGRSTTGSRGVEIHSNSDLKQTAKSITIGTKGFTEHLTTSADFISKQNWSKDNWNREYFDLKESIGNYNSDVWGGKNNTYGKQTTEVAFQSTNAGVANTNCGMSNYNYAVTFNTYGSSNNWYGSSFNRYGSSLNHYVSSRNLYMYSNNNTKTGLHVSDTNFQLNNYFTNNSNYSFVRIGKANTSSDVTTEDSVYKIVNGEYVFNTVQSEFASRTFETRNNVSTMIL